MLRNSILVLLRGQVNRVTAFGIVFLLFTVVVSFVIMSLSSLSQEVHSSSSRFDLVDERIP